MRNKYKYFIIKNYFYPYFLYSIQSQLIIYYIQKLQMLGW